MIEDKLGLLLVVLWQGFSLALVVTILARAALRDSGASRGLRLSRRLRFYMAAFALVGLFGAAMLAGTPAGLSSEAIVATLLGAGAGVAAGVRMSDQGT